MQIDTPIREIRKGSWHIVRQTPAYMFIGIHLAFHDGKPSVNDPTALYQRGDWGIAICLPFVSISYKRYSTWQGSYACQ